MNYLRREMEEKKANAEIAPRSRLTPEFSKPGVTYCSQIAPSQFWVERPNGGSIPTYCCLDHGHVGPHRWSLKFRGQEPEPPQR